MNDTNRTTYGSFIKTHSRYTVYQNNIKELRPLINEHGWDEAAKLRKEVEAHLECSNKGSSGWKTEYAEYYKLVCDVRSFDLNGVFEAGNIGPEYLLDRHAPMHSVSVGDLILAPTGRMYMVDPSGFTEVSVFQGETV